jgi:two-component system, LytTR family, response regulator
MNVKCFIIEDMPLAAENLQIQLSEFDQIEIIGHAENYTDAIEMINRLKPDLLFCDLQIGNKLGFDVLDACIGNYEFVIFTTAYDKFALKAHEYDTISYLLKPIDQHHLALSIHKVINYLTKTQNENNTISTSVTTMDNSPKVKNKKLFVYTDQTFQAINIEHILYLQAETSSTIIVTIDSKFKISKRLAYYEDLLIPFVNFVRIHKSYIINADKIIKATKGLKPSITLENNIEIPISVLQKSNVFLQLGINLE